uniref:hypothetical protein n=1 Tax=Geobacillus sp. (strain Y412MC10) TaxID=481743 RepID=UPI001C931084
LVRFGVGDFGNVRVGWGREGIRVRKGRWVGVRRGVVLKVLEREGVGEGLGIGVWNVVLGTVEVGVLIEGIRLVLDVRV